MASVPVEEHAEKLQAMWRRLSDAMALAITEDGVPRDDENQRYLREALVLMCARSYTVAGKTESEFLSFCLQAFTFLEPFAEKIVDDTILSSVWITQRGQA